MTAAMEKERKPKLSQKQARMRDAVKYLKEYMRTYDKQHGYLDYSDTTLIDDVLYGLGVALSEDNKAASGYDKFKDRLRDHLGLARSLASPQVPVEAASRTVTVPLEHAEAIRDFFDSATAAAMTNSRANRTLLRKAYGRLVIEIHKASTPPAPPLLPEEKA